MSTQTKGKARFPMGPSTSCPNISSSCSISWKYSNQGPRSSSTLTPKEFSANSCLCPVWLKAGAPLHTQSLWKAACDSSCTLQNSHFLLPPQLFITPCLGMERILPDYAAPNRNPMFWFVTFLVTGKLKKGFLFFIYSHPTSGFSQSFQWPDTREWRDSQQGWQPAPAGC